MVLHMVSSQAKILICKLMVLRCICSLALSELQIIFLVLSSLSLFTLLISSFRLYSNYFGDTSSILSIGGYSSILSSPATDDDGDNDKDDKDDPATNGTANHRYVCVCA